MNQKYSSQIYLAIAASGAEGPTEGIPGYVGAARIADASSARYQLEIPGMGGRDGMDYTVFEQGGATWFSAGGSLFMQQSAVPALYTGGGWSYATVQDDGYARWYAVDADGAGQTMTVQLPADSGFWVYDADGQVTASSVLWDDGSAVLPEGGLVVFAGNPGARFHLRFAA